MKIEIWFEFASTYSYLTVSRAENVVERAGVGFEWKPFLLGPIFREKGWKTSPFILDEIKGSYMWRDVARRAKHYGLAFARPSIFPMNSLMAARIMMAALKEPWCGAYAKDVFAAQFARGEDISDPNILARALKTHTSDPGHWLALAQTDRVKQQLRSQTETAKSLGLFGAPSFRVGDELFWGDDRLEDAIAWAADAQAK
ncbi:MAG: 2-hydroxychromene-2-carboxylate isomerase [Pseudomonadota bacterium]